MSGRSKRHRLLKKHRGTKKNMEPVTQDCCGAPKNGHFGDCPGTGGKK